MLRLFIECSATIQNSLTDRIIRRRLQLCSAESVEVPFETEVIQSTAELDRKEILATLQGDGDAFAQLVNRHQSTIASHMWKFTSDGGMHEELVHDAFVEAFQSLSQFRFEGHFIQWLRTIATRRGYRYWKENRQRQKFVPLTATEHHLIQTFDTNQESAEAAVQLIRKVFSQLSPRDRLVLTLIYWDGCSIAEAAELAGWSQTMVKVQAWRARNKLKKLLEQKV